MTAYSCNLEDLGSDTSSWLLVPSPLLGAASWAGVFEVLHDLGQDVQVHQPVMTTVRDLDHLGSWVSEILSMPRPKNPAVVIGHSAACPRMPYLVDRLLANGWEIEAMILVDGRFPDGLADTESEPHFAALIDGLIRPDNYLPPWPRWWGPLADGLINDSELRSKVFGEAKPIPRNLFDQPIPLPELPRSVGRAYLAYGESYVYDLKQADESGWLAKNLDGDHLHHVVAPAEVTSALVSMVSELRS